MYPEKADLVRNVRPCSRCKKTLPLTEFRARFRKDRNPNKQYWDSACKPCRNEQWRGTPEDGRRKRLAARYGLTPERFAAMLAEQGGCAICHRTEASGRGWQVDHDHSCCATRARCCGKCVRGILCHNCNAGLGNARDDKDILRKMIAYLEEHGG